MWNTIVNPITGKKVNLQSKKGQQIINRYLYQVGGSGKVESNQPNYENLSVAGVFSYDFGVEGLPNLKEKHFTDREEEEINTLLSRDDDYLNLLNEKEKAEKPTKPNVTISINGKKCFNPKWTNKTDEHGHQLISCDTLGEVNETETIYREQLAIYRKKNTAPLIYEKKFIHMEKQKKTDEFLDYFSKVKDGDIIENLSESGYRTAGLYVTRYGGPEHLDQDFYQEWGIINEGFSLGPNFPVGYWNNAVFENAYWYRSPLPEPVGWGWLDKLKKEDFTEKVDESGNITSIVYFDWGTFILPYRKNDVVKEIENLKVEYYKLYFEEISRGVAKLVFPEE